LGTKSTRLLILIVAYNDVATIQTVLSRIPPTISAHPYRILIIDDSSSDKTFESALQYKMDNPDLDIDILYNPQSQGYGGNLKIGFQYAIDHAFDMVALLHGNGKYAPEVLDDLITPVLQNDADVVLGSRLTKPLKALKEGMPLYKYVGNRILTRAQNYLLGASLTEFHSGYRVYSVAALKSVPFAYNTNDYHFDTEIVIQFMLKGLRISEVEIPAYSSYEINLRNGIAYAWRVLQTTMTSCLNRMGIFFDRKYDVSDDAEWYSLKLGYASSHSAVLNKIAPGSKVLDIGCGSGQFAEKLKEKGCYVHGLDWLDLEEPANFDLFTRLDLNRDDVDLPREEYDFILLLDVIEHLLRPEKLLEDLREQVKGEKPIIMITVPNVAFFLVSLRLLFGQFRYGKQGVLDLTHRRLYTFKSIRESLVQSGYEIEGIKGIPAPYPKALGYNLMSRMLIALNSFLIKFSRSFFSYQVLVTAKPLPTLADLIGAATSAAEQINQRTLRS
jgi:glycosyltransferase involved in cell wall biosynthesis